MTSGLWSKLENRHANKAGTNNKNDNQSLLYQALLAPNTPQPNSNSGIFGDTSSLGDGEGNIAKAFNTFKNFNTSNTGGAMQDGVRNYINGTGGSGSAVTDAINGVVSGTGSSGSALTDAINSNAGGTALSESASNSSGGFFSKLGGGSSSGGSSVPWAAIAKVAKEGYNGISGHDDEEYSDVEESVIYPLQGAAMGSQFGPWGAAGGALYGLGYSFKDDLGMKDSNFLTQMLFPIGMGDGGGLRIGGESILDLG